MVGEAETPEEKALAREQRVKAFLERGDEKSRRLKAEMLALRPAMEAAHARANRDALLEHARMGRSISTWRDGQVVWIPPAEIFARYGFDEFGRPLPTADAPPAGRVTPPR